VAAEAICGRGTHFRGMQATAVCGAFGLTIASTGASETALKRAGISDFEKVYLHPRPPCRLLPGRQAHSSEGALPALGRAYLAPARLRRSALHWRHADCDHAGTGALLARAKTPPARPYLTAVAASAAETEHPRRRGAPAVWSAVQWPGSKVIRAGPKAPLDPGLASTVPRPLGSEKTTRLWAQAARSSPASTRASVRNNRRYHRCGAEPVGGEPLCM